MRILGFVSPARGRLLAPLAAALLTSACGGDDGARTGDDANLTEAKLVPVAFEVSGVIVGGSATTADAARASWEVACETWSDSVQRAADPTSVESHDCGAAKDIGGTGTYQYTSTPTAKLVAKLAEGTEPLAFEPGTIAGSSGPREVAYASWQAACEASLQRIKAIYGDRLLAGACQVPKDVGPSGEYLFTSPLSLWIAPPDGTEIELDGWLVGAPGPRAPAQQSWREGCDAWLADVASLSTARFLGSFSCGEVKDVGAPGIYQFQSTPLGRLAVPLQEGTKLDRKELSQVQGESGVREVAFASWRAACVGALEAAKADAGARYLAGACHLPKDVGGPGTYRFASAATVWLGDVAKAPPDPGPGPDPDPIDEDLLDSPVAAQCNERCVAMMDACDAGPVQQTCDAMCATSPTEAQIACAEETSCDALHLWSQECLLFQ